MADTEAAFKSHAVPAARAIGPLTEVGQELLDQLKDNHLTRLAANECDVQTGHYFFEILGVLERVMSSCDNIGLSILVSEELELTGVRHEYLSSLHAKHDDGYNSVYAEARERFFRLLEEDGAPELLSDI
jgi:phosphate:Na+ symporter